MTSLDPTKVNLLIIDDLMNEVGHLEFTITETGDKYIDLSLTYLH